MPDVIITPMKNCWCHSDGQSTMPSPDHPMCSWTSLLLLSGCKRRLNPVEGWLKLLWISNAIQKHWLRIDARKAAEKSVGVGQRWTSGGAGSGNNLRELNGVHAAARYGFMRVAHEPEAIVSVRDAAFLINGTPTT